MIVNYGQAAWRQELGSSQGVSSKLNLSLRSVEIPGARDLTTNLLTRPDQSQSPFFPNRNLLLLTIAGIIGYEEGSSGIVIGTNATATYPDCSQEFLDQSNEAISLSLGVELPVLAPFVSLQKEQIAQVGRSLGVALEETYSCLRGNQVPCGQCESCVDRNRVLGAV